MVIQFQMNFSLLRWKVVEVLVEGPEVRIILEKKRKLGQKWDS